MIAADKGPFDLLQKEFPDLFFLRLPGYNIQYAKSGSLIWTIARQLSKIRNSIRREHDSLQHLIGFYKIDGVISDNRFGLFTKKTPSVFITHQIHILMPANWKWLEKIIYRRNISFINSYSQCWIPDAGGESNLSGDLSHSFKMPRNAKFIGPLSRFQLPQNMNPEKTGVLVILSGPEPQRTIFETSIINQAKHFQTKITIAGGKTDGKAVAGLPSTITYYNYLASKGLESEIQAAEVIISRPGYSTIMDLYALKKRKIIFVPTPGQTEQEYLGQKFSEEKNCIFMHQKDFDLSEALSRAGTGEGFSKALSLGSQLTEAVSGFLNSC